LKNEAGDVTVSTVVKSAQATAPRRSIAQVAVQDLLRGYPLEDLGAPPLRRMPSRARGVPKSAGDVRLGRKRSRSCGGGGTVKDSVRPVPEGDPVRAHPLDQEPP
jgi:hypothetical protein